MEFVLAKKNDYKKIKKIYKEAFPKDERAPFLYLMKKYEKHNAILLCINEDNKMIGFTYVISNENLAYIFYIAIDQSFRGNGYGSKIIDEIKKRFKNKRIFLAMEEMDSKADNYQQRLKRYHFYTMNGLKELPYKIKEASVTYSIMGTDTVFKEEYEQLLKDYMGILKHLVTMEIIE